MEKKSGADKLKLGLFLGYFAVLAAERIISLAAVFSDGAENIDAQELYMVIVTIFAVTAGPGFVLTRLPKVIKSCGAGEYGKLSAAAGIILLGGMVHTKGTIPGIQFASYGILLAAMGLHAGQCVKANGGGLKKWISFAYITAFSMAIPVVYHVSETLSAAAFPVECAVSVCMTALFTIMLRRFFTKNAEYDFPLMTFLGSAAGVSAVLILRWNDTLQDVKDANIFILIFICAASAIWTAARVMMKKSGKTGK